VSFGHTGGEALDVLRAYVANPTAPAAANLCGGHEHDHQHCRH
jgi:hypothetical protein